MSDHEHGDAYFDEHRRYRYALSRIWDPLLKPMFFIGLNPSTADETKLDPTMRRVIDFAKRNGHGGIWMGNLFALRSTNPKALKVAEDPVGPMNDGWLMQMQMWCGRTCVGWGTHGALDGRDAAVRKLLAGNHLFCLGTTKDGHPKHPLYLSNDTPLQIFQDPLWRPSPAVRTEPG